MKRIILITILIATVTALTAQKVALHSAGGVSFFSGTTAFTLAYNAAAAGDTIYLPGGGFTVPSNINKKLRIYGAGHYPDSTQATEKTVLLGGILLYEDADGIYIEGVEITSHFTLNNNHSVNDVTVIRCRIGGDFTIQGAMTNPSLNAIVYNNVIVGSVNLANGQNIGIFNNIIQARVLNSYGNVFRNNIFLYSYSGASPNYKITGDNNDFYNNIFWDDNNRYFNGYSNKIYNNIFVNASPLLGTTPVSSGNFYPVTQTEIFTSHSGTAFLYESNYHLKTPAAFTGTDGKEVGIYGGYYPYKEGAVPSNPHIQLKVIAPQTDEAGKLTIEIKAGAQKK